MTVNAILFDLDGTLLDARHLYAASYTHAFMAERLDVPTLEDFVALGVTSERHFLLEHWGAEVGARIHRRMLEHYTANAGALLGGLFEGVEAMVAELRRRGVRLGIVTGKSRAAYDVTSALIDLSAFDVVIVEDDVPAPKPDPAGIRAAMAQLSIDSTIYVGDTPADAEAATRAGVGAAVALWACRPADRARFAASLGEHVWPLAAPGDLLSRLFD